MKILLGAGLFAILLSIAVGIATFFGIVNADAFLHPQMAYKRVKLVVVQGDVKPDVIIKIKPEAGCSDPTPLKVIWSIRNQPERWTADHYNFNSDAVDIWVANNVDYLRINESWSYGDKCRSLLWSVYQTWVTNKARKAVDGLAS